MHVSAGVSSFDRSCDFSQTTAGKLEKGKGVSGSGIKELMHHKIGTDMWDKGLSTGAGREPNDQIWDIWEVLERSRVLSESRKPGERGDV